MKVRLLTHIVFLLILSINIHAQNCAPPFDSLKTVSSVNYTLQIPYTWHELTAVSFKGLIKVFDGSANAALPVTFNSRPVLVYAFILQKEAKSLDEAVQSCIDERVYMPQKVFDPAFAGKKEYVTLANGYSAYILHTRFYRETNAMYQSQYDLILYSEELKQSFCYTVSVQYSDSTYAFEDNYHLETFARSLFSYFTPQWN